MHLNNWWCLKKILVKNILGKCCNLIVTAGGMAGQLQSLNVSIEKIRWFGGKTGVLFVSFDAFGKVDNPPTSKSAAQLSASWDNNGALFYIMLSHQCWHKRQ